MCLDNGQHVSFRRFISLVLLHARRLGAPTGNSLKNGYRVPSHIFSLAPRQNPVKAVFSHISTVSSTSVASGICNGLRSSVASPVSEPSQSRDPKSNVRRLEDLAAKCRSPRCRKVCSSWRCSCFMQILVHEDSVFNSLKHEHRVNGCDSRYRSPDPRSHHVK